MVEITTTLMGAITAVRRDGPTTITTITIITCNECRNINVHCAMGQ